ncbi:hypothetical protein [Aquimarina rhabdastrellae]
MPANPKYLTSSNSQKFAKLSAGILGGYVLSAMLHMVLALWVFDHKQVLITSVYSLFLIWMIFLIIPYFSKNGWKVWGVYLFFIIISAVLIYFGKQQFSI